MNRKWAYVIVIIHLCVNNVICLIDPITIGTVAAIGMQIMTSFYRRNKKQHLRLFIFNLIFNCFHSTGGIGYWLFGGGGKESTMKTYNRYFESCDSNAIPFNVDALKLDLERNLYGQHIVNTTLLAALRSHKRNFYISQKPLVMSFHGTPGTGKNFVADRIVKHFYERGDKSRFVHKYRGRIDFPLASEVDLYRVNMMMTSSSRTIPPKMYIYIKHPSIFPI